MTNFGNVQIDKEKCTACGICVDRCILDNLVLKIAACRQACPLHLNCQGYIHYISQGRFDEALQEIYKRLPFPGIIGRVCSQDCESVCKRNEKDGQAVAIRRLKRFLADNLYHLKPDVSICEEKTQRVAVVGSGPAGMMAAFDLRKKGYQVTIFEALDRYGGMLTQCIPVFRLPSEVVDREFGILLQMGVQLQLNTPIGEKYRLEDLCTDFDAVFLGTGAWQSLRLNLSGENAQGIWGAIDFLKVAKEKGSIDLGERVLVIGGGNTAVSAAQVAKRLGAREVNIVALESRGEMPAFLREVETALEEGIALQNSFGPARILTSDGHISGMEFKRCLRLFDNEGRFDPIYDEEDKKVLAADAAIIAVGQVPELSYVNGTLSLNNAYLKVNPETLQTDNPKIFAGGDVVEGKKSVIHAMSHGRRAAFSINCWLQGEGLYWGRGDFDTSHELHFEVDLSLGSDDARTEDKKIPTEERYTFRELELGMTPEEATREARRCLKCGDVYAKNKTCWYCLPCEIECPHQALRVELPYLVR